jgi:hypothetical protein
MEETSLLTDLSLHLGAISTPVIAFVLLQIAKKWKAIKGVQSGQTYFLRTLFFVIIFVGNVARIIYTGDGGAIDEETLKTLGSESVIQSLLGLIAYKYVVKK